MSTVGAGYWFNVFIYDPSLNEASGNNAIVISTDKHTAIGIEKRKNETIRKPYPEEDCIDYSRYTQVQCVRAFISKDMYDTRLKIAIVNSEKWWNQTV